MAELFRNARTPLRASVDFGAPQGDRTVQVLVGRGLLAEVPPLDAATQAKISEAVRQRLPPPMTSADPAHVPPPITLADLKRFITRP